MDEPGWDYLDNLGKGRLGERVEPEFYLPIVQVPEEARDWIERSMTLVARSECWER